MFLPAARRVYNSVAGTSASHLSRRYVSLLVAEHNNKSLSPSTLNAATAAKQLEDDLHVLVIGSGCSGVAEEAAKIDGVKKVLVKDDPIFTKLLAEPVTDLLKSVQSRNNYSNIVAPSTSNSKNFLPRLAAYLDVAPISDIIAVKEKDTFVRPIYAGNALETVKTIDPVRIITVRTTAFEKAATDGSSASIEQVEDKVDSNKSKFISEEVGQSERPELTSASVVISGGRGMKSGENFEMLYKLADLFGGAVGASRAAVDDGMVPNDMQVGQTGKVVAPQLYIAVGISGAIQHLAGMKDSKVIVAINKNEDAPIFQVADYGVVGDLFKVVPELTEAVSAKKSK